MSLVSVARVTVRLLILVIPLSACGFATHSERWNEEALLHDRRIIVVDRNVDYIFELVSGDEASMMLFKSWPTRFGLRFKHPDTQETIEWKGEQGVSPVLLDIVKGVPYLVLTGQPNLAHAKEYGCPELPYFFLRYEKRIWNKWIPIPVDEFPEALRTANLTPHYPNAKINIGYQSHDQVLTNISEAENSSAGFFQAKIPRGYDTWNFSLKNTYRYTRRADDCHPPRNPPAEIALPPPQRVALEILETRNFTPEWVMGQEEWSRATLDAVGQTYCTALLKPANPDDPLLAGTYVFVHDETGQKKIQFKPFAVPGLNMMCNEKNVWVTDYDVKNSKVGLRKYRANGDLVYRIDFEQPEMPKGFLGGIIKPTFKSEDGYLYFDWWGSKSTGGETRVKRSIKARFREPQKTD